MIFFLWNNSKFSCKCATLSSVDKFSCFENILHTIILRVISHFWVQNIVFIDGITIIYSVVKTTVLVQNMDDFGKVNEVYAEYFKGKHSNRCWIFLNTKMLLHCILHTVNMHEGGGVLFQNNISTFLGRFW